MKKYIIFIFIVLLALSCLSGCSLNRKKANLTEQNDSFTYINKDGKLLLYSYGGGDLYPAGGEIYLWDIEKQTKDLICQGRLPKWIVK